MLHRVRNFFEQTGIADDWKAVRSTITREAWNYQQYHDFSELIDERPSLLERWTHGEDVEPPSPHFQWPEDPSLQAKLIRDRQGALTIANTEQDPAFQIYGEILTHLQDHGSLDVVTDILMVVESVYIHKGYKIPSHLTVNDAFYEARRQQYCYDLSIKYCNRLMHLLDMGGPIYTAP